MSGMSWRHVSRQLYHLCPSTWTTPGPMPASEQEQNICVSQFIRGGAGGALAAPLDPAGTEEQNQPLDAVWTLTRVGVEKLALLLLLSLTLLLSSTYTLGYPLQPVAIIAGNFELAELIKTHKETDIGEFSASIVHLFFLLTRPPP
ncbi:hypothetical protein D4764_02G0006230 [Takifugu flavidus]|uniref:Uncharacterized protein n=1 Tax=Takifugu flavidus TaxID=433684 RepID=A0A5C6NJ01_9TELE|nr:hypothetical protein D4764_02G0006230 [Takifugu flavidus]